MAEDSSLAIAETLSEAQIRDLVELYQTAWWSHQRTQPDVERMLQHSDLIIAISDRAADNRLVGFARVLTDYVYRGTIWDVLVAESHRGRGLGRMLIETVFAHPSLAVVESFSLVCLPDMVPFYEKFGFTADVEPIRWMRRPQTSHPDPATP